jgi:hypothetical protein
MLHHLDLSTPAVDERLHLLDEVRKMAQKPSNESNNVKMIKK